MFHKGVVCGKESNDDARVRVWSIQFALAKWNPPPPPPYYSAVPQCITEQSSAKREERKTATNFGIAV